MACYVCLMCTVQRYGSKRKSSLFRFRSFSFFLSFFSPSSFSLHAMVLRGILDADIKLPASAWDMSK